MSLKFSLIILSLNLKAIYFCDEDIKVNDYLDYYGSTSTNENKIKKLSLT